MSQQIRMSPDMMRGKAGSYRSEASQVREVIDRMTNLLTELESEWEGLAAVAFKNRFEEFKPGFRKAADLIDEIAEALVKSAATMEETDQNMATAVNQS
jgi:WXG100 family type VII secretion target